MRHGMGVAAFVAAALAAWGVGRAAAGAPGADVVKKHCNAMEVLEVLAQDLIPPAEAIAKAAKQTGTAIPVEIELVAAKKGEKRVPAWEIDCVDGEKMLEAKVDARTGEVLSVESEADAAEVKKQKARLAGAKTGLAEALAATAGRGLLLEAEIGGSGEKVGWETSFVHSGRPSRVCVCAVTGKVVAPQAAAGKDDDEDGDDDGEDDDDDGDDEDDDEDDD